MARIGSYWMLFYAVGGCLSNCGMVDQQVAQLAAVLRQALVRTLSVVVNLVWTARENGLSASFIEHLAPSGDLAQEQIAHRDALCQFPRCADNDVERERAGREPREISSRCWRDRNGVSMMTSKSTSLSGLGWP